MLSSKDQKAVALLALICVGVIAAAWLLRGVSDNALPRYRQVQQEQTVPETADTVELPEAAKEPGKKRAETGKRSGSAKKSSKVKSGKPASAPRDVSDPSETLPSR